MLGGGVLPKVAGGKLEEFYLQSESYNMVNIVTREILKCECLQNDRCSI